MTNIDRASNRPSGRMNGGRALAEMLRLAGVGPMFGMGGFQLLPFYDALAQLGMRHFLINDERCGAFAANHRVACVAASSAAVNPARRQLKSAARRWTATGE